MDSITGQVGWNEYGVESVGCVMKRFQLVCDDERESVYRIRVRSEWLVEEE